MARGERGEGPRGGTDAYGLWAVLAVIFLFAAFLVALALRGCEDDPHAITPGTPPPVTAAQVSFGRLRDRDGVVPADPSRVAELRARGYERLEGDVPATEVPFRQTLGALEGLCGVAQVAPDPTSSVERAVLAGLELAPGPVDGALTFGACGAHELAVSRGVGRASVALWVMPGLTPADVAASELPAEVALGFAEAEHLLEPEGWRATDRAIRAELAAGTATWALPRPARGCVGWVVVALGLDSARSQHAGLTVHEDARAGRQLLGAVSCADGGEVIVGDGAGDGGTLYALPFERGGGPRVATTPGGRLTTIGAVRLTTAEALTLPAGE